MTITRLARFERMVHKSGDGCWLWTGTVQANGYGSFWDGSSKVPAHRFAYSYYRSLIPSDREVHHACSVRACVNPWHMDLVTRAENMREMKLRGNVMAPQPARPRIRRDSEARFHRFVEKSDDCWTWTGGTRPSRSGAEYGRFSVNGKLVTAHRFAYELHVGPIPDGLTIDHLCKNTLCVNPLHLEAVTIRENILRSGSAAAKHASKTHCLRNHAFSEWGFVNSKGSRECRKCRRDYTREYSRQRRGTPPESHRSLREW